MTTLDRPPPAPEGDRWRLEDQRQFLIRSLRDAELEHDAGDLSDADFDLLCRRDEARLAAVEEELARLDREAAAVPGLATAAPGADGKAARPEAVPERRRAAAGAEDGAPQLSDRVPRPRNRRRRRWLAVVGAVSLAAGVVLLVVHLTAPRLLGETGDGSVQLDPAQTVHRQLDQAAALVSRGSVAEGLDLYLQVLQEDPRQPTALAEAGYLEWEYSANARVRDAGRALVERSIAVQPGNYAAHLFLGVIELVQDANAAGATDQFTLFLAEHPPASLVAQAAPTIRRAFEAAKRPVPPGLG
ncbi:MAG TPA: hypothetical protein VKV25_07915 [Acidimicrobiales bacterium]|nr:hypothetical protein [Acidimicrobiales bacterium]